MYTMFWIDNIIWFRILRYILDQKANPHLVNPFSGAHIRLPLTKTLFWGQKASQLYCRNWDETGTHFGSEGTDYCYHDIMFHGGQLYAVNYTGNLAEVWNLGDDHVATKVTPQSSVRRH